MEMIKNLTQMKPHHFDFQFYFTELCLNKSYQLHKLNPFNVT